MQLSASITELVGPMSADDFLSCLERIRGQLSAAGADVSETIRALVLLAFPEFEEAAHLLALAPQTNDATIAHCYRRLHALPRDDHDAIRKTLAELRALQEQEAERLSSVAASARIFDPDAAATAIRAAEELLARHETSTAKD